MRSGIGTVLLVILAGIATGCQPGARAPEVVVLTSHSAADAEPLFADFSRTSGIKVLPKFDALSAKRVGLGPESLGAEGDPQCDLLWDSELLTTLLLDNRGLLASFAIGRDDDLPSLYRSRQDTWHAFAARPRVLLVNLELMKDEPLPRSIRDLADGRWRGRCGMGRPTGGTSAAHAACLFAVLGSDRAQQLLLNFKDNRAQILSTSKDVALGVGAGRLVFGLTDSDDAQAELDKAMPVAIIYPDQGEGQLGTLFIPNLVSVMKVAPHPQAARRLAGYLTSPDIETQLAAGESALVPLNAQVDTMARIRMPADVRAMAVDYATVGKAWSQAAEFLQQEFGRQ